MSLTSQVAQGVLLHVGKALITRFIRGRRVRMCPNCGQKVFIRGRVK